jgi:hypothetical protein
MEQFQERVVIEKHELDVKVDRLKGFVASTKFVTIPISEQKRMSKQLSIMQDYSAVLGERISAFN